MSGISSYDEVMVTILVGNLKKHLTTIERTLVFPDVHRDVVVGLIDKIYKLLNKED